MFSVGSGAKINVGLVKKSLAKMGGHVFLSAILRVTLPRISIRCPSRSGAFFRPAKPSFLLVARAKSDFPFRSVFPPPNPATLPQSSTDNF